MNCDTPTVNNHGISFNNNNLRIRLNLNGIFSYFNTRKPLPSELHDMDNIFITPDASEWNQYCTSYAQNEQAMANYNSELSDHQVELHVELMDGLDEVFKLAPISTSKYDLAVDIAISDCRI